MIAPMLLMQLSVLGLNVNYRRGFLASLKFLIPRSTMAGVKPAAVDIVPPVPMLLIALDFISIFFLIDLVIYKICIPIYQLCI